MIAALFADFIPWLIGLGVTLAGAFAVYRAGAKAEKNKAVVKRLEADRATSERIDNAKPAKNVDDARGKLHGFLRTRE